MGHGTGAVTITHDDRIIGGIVEGTFTGSLEKADAGWSDVAGSFRVCRTTLWDLDGGP